MGTGTDTPKEDLKSLSLEILKKLSQHVPDHPAVGDRGIAGGNF